MAGGGEDQCSSDAEAEDSEQLLFQVVEDPNGSHRIISYIIYPLVI